MSVTVVREKKNSNITKGEKPNVKISQKKGRCNSLFMF